MTESETPESGIVVHQSVYEYYNKLIIIINTYLLLLLLLFNLALRSL